MQHTEARLCGVGWDREGSATVQQTEARLCGVGWDREGSATVQQTEARLCGVGWDREGSATVQQTEAHLCGVGWDHDGDGDDVLVQSLIPLGPTPPHTGAPQSAAHPTQTCLSLLHIR